MVSILNVNGSRGEITPLMHARSDTEFYQQGYAECRNVVITRYGPQTRVPGTLAFGRAKNADHKVKMIAFEFSETQVYGLEFGVGYLRFWTPSGQVVSGGAPYELATPYTEANLTFLHGRQSGDVIYIFCDGVRPKLLTRISETNWTLTDYKPKDGPYLDINDTPTTMTLGGTTNLVPIMTSNTTPAPVNISGSSGDVNLYKLFAGTKDVSVNVAAGPAGGVSFDLGAGNAAVLDNYFLVAPANNAEVDAMFSQWDLRGSQDGTNWVTIDSRDNEKGWAGSETRFYETNNKTAFRHYNLFFSGGGGSSGANAQLGGWYMHRAPQNQTPVTLTASSTVNVNGGAGFRADDVGRAIRLQGQDGLWRWAEIAAYVSTTQVTVRMYGQSFMTVQPIQNWMMGAWSAITGWPRTGRFYEDRLALAGWPDDPIGLALSVSSAYDNFRTSTPGVDDDAIKIRMTGGRLDIVNWLAESGALMAGTGGGLRSIGGRDNSNVLKVDNIRQKLETSTAASGVQPVNVESVSLFVDRLQRRLYELAYSYEADGYLARELSVVNDHLFEIGVVRVEYIDAPYKFAVVLRSDGKVVFFAYDRDQKIAGGTLCDFGGFAEDIMVLQGPTYQELWLVVRRERDGTTYRHIEKLAPFYNGRIAPDDPPIYAACSVTYDGVETNQISGATLLAGATVGVWADGRDIGDAVVTVGGVLTLPSGLTAERIVAGERMAWRMQSLPLPTANGGNGSGLAQSIRVASMTVDAFESARIYGGSLLHTDRLRTEDEVEFDPEAPEPIRTCNFNVPVDDSWQNRGVYVIEGNSMFPATIRGVSLVVELEP